jgi:hypothetical protein
MKLRFTHHAQYRMDERGISVSSIKSVLKNPDHTEDVFGNKSLSRKQIDGGTIEVIYVKDKNEFVIITIYQI